MPIHDQGYSHYHGARRPPGQAWPVIAWQGIRRLLSRRAFIGLLVLSWLPFVVRAAQIYAAATLPQATFLAPDVRLFRQFLEQQRPFVFFVAVYAGAGLIANDRRLNALQIYLSKPLSRWEYVFGKFAILVSLLLFVTWVPGILLLVVQVAFSGSFTFLVANLLLFPAITAFSLVQVVTVASAMLALSSLSRSSRYVAMLFAGLIFFPQAVYGVLYAMTRNSRLAWISVVSDLSQIGDAVFRLPRQSDVPVFVALLVVAGLIAGSSYVLHRRVRAVDVIA